MKPRIYSLPGGLQRRVEGLATRINNAERAPMTFTDTQIVQAVTKKQPIKAGPTPLVHLPITIIVQVYGRNAANINTGQRVFLAATDSILERWTTNVSSELLNNLEIEGGSWLQNGGTLFADDVQTYSVDDAASGFPGFLANDAGTLWRFLTNTLYRRESGIWVVKGTVSLGDYEGLINQGLAVKDDFVAIGADDLSSSGDLAPIHISLDGGSSFTTHSLVPHGPLSGSSSGLELVITNNGILLAASSFELDYPTYGDNFFSVFRATIPSTSFSRVDVISDQSNNLAEDRSIILAASMYLVKANNTIYALSNALEEALVHCDVSPYGELLGYPHYVDIRKMGVRVHSSTNDGASWNDTNSPMVPDFTKYSLTRNIHPTGFYDGHRLVVMNSSVLESNAPDYVQYVVVLIGVQYLGGAAYAAASDGGFSRTFTINGQSYTFTNHPLAVNGWLDGITPRNTPPPGMHLIEALSGNPDDVDSSPFFFDRGIFFYARLASTTTQHTFNPLGISDVDIDIGNFDVDNTNALGTGFNGMGIGEWHSFAGGTFIGSDPHIDYMARIRDVGYVPFSPGTIFPFSGFDDEVKPHWSYNGGWHDITDEVNSASGFVRTQALLGVPHP